MNALIMLVLGAGVGAGALLVLHSLRPTTLPMHQVFDAVERPGTTFNAPESVTRDRPIRRLLIAIGKAMSLGLGDDNALRRDLAVTGSTLEDHAIVKAGTPAAALLACYSIWVIGQVVGLSISPLWATLVALSAAGLALHPF